MRRDMFFGMKDREKSCQQSRDLFQHRSRVRAESTILFRPLAKTIEEKCLPLVVGSDHLLFALNVLQIGQGIIKREDVIKFLSYCWPVFLKQRGPWKLRIGKHRRIPHG